jgi:hypothetical protein
MYQLTHFDHVLSSFVENEMFRTDLILSEIFVYHGSKLFLFYNHSYHQSSPELNFHSNNPLIYISIHIPHNIPATDIGFSLPDFFRHRSISIKILLISLFVISFIGKQHSPVFLLKL